MRTITAINKGILSMKSLNANVKGLGFESTSLHDSNFQSIS